MNLGTQYYRAPFPNAKYWDDDMRRMKDAGLNCVQLWVLWGWVEAKPGTFRFDDYDRLVELAGKHGLGVVLSTIAEIHPYWIHREIPGSEMITEMGQKVVSSNRGECHFGLTPGGCFDHPEVFERMSAFLEAVTTRYRTAEHLRGWDAWNELRWNVHADGAVCYCDHTLQAFHTWLDESYGGLDGLNDAWIRRYGEWSEVMPGKLPTRPFTEMMAFTKFLTWRSCNHGAMRYDVIKKLDPDRPVTLHGGSPSPDYAGYAPEQALNRGNDWFFADHLDGVGCSSFPKWGGIDDADFGMRIEFVKSAARGKHVWLSELQGGRAAGSFEMHHSVDARSQQRWIWNGLACGADTILFWCWRDEVFGKESAGFGIIGADGLAEERVEAMEVTGKAITEHADLIDAYEPADAEVGLLFSPLTYHHHYASEGNAGRARDALFGYARALVRKSIPYIVVEDEHLDALSGLKVLIMPRVTATSAKLERAVQQFVEKGGTLVCESECGAFTPEGLYRYPEDRFTTRMTGLCEVGRRHGPEGDTLTATVAGRTYHLAAAHQWMTPWAPAPSDAWAANDDGALLASVPVGDGHVVLSAPYLGEAYYRARSGPLEDLLERIVLDAGWRPRVEIASPAPTADSFLYVKTGTSNGRRIVFVFFQEGEDEAHLKLASGFLEADSLTDIITGTKHRPVAGSDGATELRVPVPDWRFCVLVEDTV